MITICMSIFQSKQLYTQNIVDRTGKRKYNKIVHENEIAHGGDYGKYNI